MHAERRQSNEWRNLKPVVCLAGSRFVAPGRVGGLQMSLEIRPDGGWSDLILRLRADKPQYVDFLGVELGALRLAAADRFLGDIPGFLERTGVLPALEAQAHKRTASFYGLLWQPAQTRALLLGMAGTHEDPTAFFLQNGRLLAGWRPQRQLSGELVFKLTAASNRDPLVLLSEYGRRLAPLGRVGAQPPTGWNTWDFYGGAISMRDVRGEMPALDELRCRRALRYLTVDMGWESAWGDWTPNRKFPGRLRDIAGRIRRAGWQPGIWMAPLQVGLFTRLARYRRDLCLHDAAGSPVIVDTETCGPALLLDFSLPEARELVGNWFAGMRQAGFQLFKIDYLYTRFIAQARHAAAGGQAGFVRNVFRTIRENVGPDAHVVNCGGLKEAVLGLADSARMTVDIHNFWGHIRNNARQLAQSFWMNRRLWHNDPDFAVVRHPGNCNARYLNMPHAVRPLTAAANFWMRGPPASASELRMWLSVVRLNAGSLFLADSIRTLSAAGRADLERLFPPLTESFMPLDLFERDRPGIWLSQDRRRPTLGLFNWYDRSLTIELPPPLRGPLRAVDFWTRNKIKLEGSLTLDGRSGMLLEL